MFNQQIHGSKRSLRSVEDFTEFEQRTAYPNGDQIRAIKKGMNVIDRLRWHTSRRFKHDRFSAGSQGGSHDRAAGPYARRPSGDCRRRFISASAVRRLSQPPAYTDHVMHDLFLERFGAEADGPIKSFALRGIRIHLPIFMTDDCSP